MSQGSLEDVLDDTSDTLRHSRQDFEHEKPLTREEKTYLLHADRGDYATVKR